MLVGFCLVTQARLDDLFYSLVALVGTNSNMDRKKPPNSNMWAGRAMGWSRSRSIPLCL
jgi:hypothetical protein